VGGTSLFAFGDIDGDSKTTQLQHPLDLLYIKEIKQLWVADSFNNKIKMIEWDNNSYAICKTLSGNIAGYSDSTLLESQFWEPSGLVYFKNAENGKFTVLVADKNNHIIRRMTLGDNKVETMEIKDIPKPFESSVTINFQCKEDTCTI